MDTRRPTTALMQQIDDEFIFPLQIRAFLISIQFIIGLPARRQTQALTHAVVMRARLPSIAGNPGFFAIHTHSSTKTFYEYFGEGRTPMRRESSHPGVPTSAGSVPVSAYNRLNR